jgi:phosphoenolpyruvate---glycerone phosphotransferase subunit DhaM
MDSPSPNGLTQLLLVSHSAKIAEGLAELLSQVAGPEVSIEAIGGASDGSLGTDGSRVMSALQRAADGAGTVVVMDIGSSILAVRASLSELEPEQAQKVFLADAPLVEGALAAAVTASTGAPPEVVAKAAEEARNAAKL